MNKYRKIVDKLVRQLIKNGMQKEIAESRFAPPNACDLLTLRNPYKTFGGISSFYSRGELECLKQYRVPDSVIDFYSCYAPVESVSFNGDTGLMTLKGVREANAVFAPGGPLIKYGVLAFDITTGGNAICMDFNQLTGKEPRIIFASYLTFRGKKVRLLNGNEWQERDLSYDVIDELAPEISKTFSGYLDRIAEEEIEDIEVYMSA